MRYFLAAAGFKPYDKPAPQVLDYYDFAACRFRLLDRVYSQGEFLFTDRKRLDKRSGWMR